MVINPIRWGPTRATARTAKMRPPRQSSLPLAGCGEMVADAGAVFWDARTGRSNLARARTSTVRPKAPARKSGGAHLCAALFTRLFLLARPMKATQLYDGENGKEKRGESYKSADLGKQHIKDHPGGNMVVDLAGPERHVTCLCMS